MYQKPGIRAAPHVGMPLLLDDLDNCLDLEWLRGHETCQAAARHLSTALPGDDQTHTDRRASNRLAHLEGEERLCFQS